MITEKRAGGTAAVVLGALALYEAWKLSAYRTHLLAGDHAFPGIAGLLLILFGVWLFFESNDEEDAPAKQTETNVRKRIWLLLGILFAYCIFIPLAGYTVSTLSVSVCLVRTVGQYRWRTAIIAGVLMTISLYFLFVVLLKTPVPAGLLSNL